MAPLVIREEKSERHLVGTDRNPVPTCQGFCCSWLYCGRVRGSALVLFLFYVNISGMRPRSCLSSKPLTKPVPWVLLRVSWSIPLVKWFHCLSFSCGEKGGWAKSYYFLFTPTFPWFLVFPLFLTLQRFSTFEFCLLGLLLSDNNNN